MSQQLVIKDGLVVAVHTVDQNLTGKYAGCEIVVWDGEPVGQFPSTELEPGVFNPVFPDPRSEADKQECLRIKSRSELLLQHSIEQSQGVTLSNGWRCGYTDVQRSNYTSLLQLAQVNGPARVYKMWDANGVCHEGMSSEQIVTVLTEYSLKVADEYERQLDELAAFGW